MACSFLALDLSQGSLVVEAAEVVLVSLLLWLLQCCLPWAGHRECPLCVGRSTGPASAGTITRTGAHGVTDIAAILIITTPQPKPSIGSPDSCLILRTRRSITGSTSAIK